MHPHSDDVIVRQVRHEGADSVIFLVGTPTAPDQFTVVSRDAAVSRALAFAKRFHVRAWFANDTDPDARFVLLSTLQTETTEVMGSPVPAKSASRQTDVDDAAARQGTKTPLGDLALRIRAEFLEMPGMYLTDSHIQRLCGVERSPCQAALDALVESKFLCIRPDGTYTRRSNCADITPRPATLGLETPKALPKTV
jgi:hypothetical protein